jgi:hypothetical protein
MTETEMTEDLTIAEFIEIHGAPPYDLNYWGPGGVDISRWSGKVHMMRGADYHDTGAPVASGIAGTVRKISTGRKERGSASDSYDRQQARND